jgi:hypothetical protein
VSSLAESRNGPRRESGRRCPANQSHSILQVLVRRDFSQPVPAPVKFSPAPAAERRSGLPATHRRGFYPWIIFIAFLSLLAFSATSAAKTVDRLWGQIRFELIAGLSQVFLWSRWRHRNDGPTAKHAAHKDSADRFMSSFHLRMGRTPCACEPDKQFTALRVEHLEMRFPDGTVHVSERGGLLARHANRRVNGETHPLRSASGKSV